MLIIAITLAANSMLFASEAPKRQKAIDFDDETIEGMNKRPLDSLSQISERNKKNRKPHLYRTRAQFNPEVNDSIRNARFTP